MEATQLPETKQSQVSADNSGNGIPSEVLALAEQLVQHLTQNDGSIEASTAVFT